MNFKSFFYLIIIASVYADLFADITSLAAHNEIAAPVKYQWTNSAYVGYSWSLNAGFTNPDSTVFKQHSAGDDGKLGNTSYAGIALSRYLCDWFSLGFAYEIYNNFAYQNIHVGDDASVYQVTSTEMFGNKFTRSFALANQAALFIFYFNLPDKHKLTCGKFLVEPVLGGGVGPAINYMTSFQAVGLTAQAPFHQISTVGIANVKTSLAWYLSIGIGFKPVNTAATFGICYRYYTGGIFSSGSQFVFYDADNGGELITAKPWTGTLKTNQLSIFLDFDF